MPDLAPEPYRAKWEQSCRETRAGVFSPPPTLSVSEWAERHRVLSQGSMAGQRWTNEEAPYLVEIMDTFSDPDRPSRGVVRKSARVGYTEGVIGNCIAWRIHHAPAHVIVMQPSDEEAGAYSKENVTPMVERSPLRECLSIDSYKSSDNTIAFKRWQNGSLAIIGTKDSNLRRRSARDALSDEIDELDVAHGQGDPLARLEKRLGDFEDGFHLMGSTPTLKDLSRIDREYEGSDRRRWFISCPHCNGSQVLEWGGKDAKHGIKWDKEVVCRACGCESDYGDECSECGTKNLEVRHLPEAAHYVCEKNGCRIEPHEKRAMIQAGEWLPTNPEGRYPGWHINALMSLFPGARWERLVEEWLEAILDPEKLKVFVNTVLGETWEERDQKKITAKGLEDRAEAYVDTEGQMIEVPDGVGILTGFVDVQGDRLELLVRGYGLASESWDILHHRIWGDPTHQGTWGQLDFMLAREFAHASGAKLRIAAAMIDSGYKQDEVFDFVRPRERRNVWASRGDATGNQKAPPLKRPVRADANGVKVWTIGTFVMKDALFARLAVSEPGPRYTHLRQHTPELCNGFDSEYFAQFGGEKKIRKRVKGTLKWKHEWVSVRRNEAIDLNVGCDAALRALGPGVYENVAAWVEAARNPKSADDQTSSKRRKRRGGGWAQQW